jgi:hypothetical protein
MIQATEGDVRVAVLPVLFQGAIVLTSISRDCVTGDTRMNSKVYDLVAARPSDTASYCYDLAPSHLVPVLSRGAKSLLTIIAGEPTSFEGEA